MAVVNTRSLELGRKVLFLIDMHTALEAGRTSKSHAAIGVKHGEATMSFWLAHVTADAGIRDG
jgi:hypothetical protein